MVGKPDVYILTGKSGQMAYEKICNAKPLKTPQYSKSVRDDFNTRFAAYLPEIKKNWDIIVASNK
ncbi:MAG: hypothetical protein J5687_10035 [Treponema sp.]|nr:hypothetical protein [Treponema sp.]